MVFSSGTIAFIVVYCFFLLCYFYTETTGKLSLRAPNKCILFLMFFIFGTYAVFNTGRHFDPASPYLFVAALFLAALGDLFLLFSYNRGGDFFLAGNICFIVYSILVLDTLKISVSTYWWVFLLIGVLYVTYVLLILKLPKIFKLGNMKSGILLYLATIIPNGCFGIALMAYASQYFLMGLGLFLFMLSDFDIVVHKFVVPHNPWVLRLNSALYFIGMLLVVLNFAVIY